MNARIIDGAGFAAGLGDRIEGGVAEFEAATGRRPALAVVLVGQDPASEVYVRNKGRMARKLGMRSVEELLPADVAQADLIALIFGLNADPETDGILVQLPLPDGLDARAVIAAIDPAKDVDGLHPLNAGYLASGLPGLVSCTPLGCLMLLKSVLGDLSGRDAIVIGRSILVGKPMAQLLLAADCSVTVAHSHSRNLPAKIAAAEIVVAAVGAAGMIRGEWIRPGATVIDVGTTRVPDGDRMRLKGDVDFATAASRAGAITPVPGGVGPMTIMSLMHNTLMAAHLRARLPPPALH